MGTQANTVSRLVQDFVKRPHGHFIDNAVTEATGQLLDVFNPATGEVIARIPDASPEVVDRAVASARRAFDSWRHTRPADRERILSRLADLIEQHGDELAELESLNQGKSIAIARAVEVGAGAECVRYMAGWATKIEGSTLDNSIAAMPGTRFRAMTLREPVGVVGAIIPWNFPLSMALWKIAPALACGCCVVVKPAEETPLTALRLAELCREAGVPDGVVNIVTGRGVTAGAALANHKGIDKLAFTGSTEVGKLIGAAALRNMTRFSLELGGKSPVIVLDDANVEAAAQGAAMSIFFNQGQVCTAGSRLFVQKSIFEQVVVRLSEIAKDLRIGPGCDPTNQINPLVSARQRDRVLAYVNQGVADGAELLAGGEHEGAGYYVKPSVLVNVDPQMSVVREEIFGPVVVAMPFDDVDEAIEAANASEFGLAGSVWSNDHRRIQHVIGELRAGTVWVNAHNVLDPNIPFGGFKQSGLGRELGRSIIDMYTESKSVLMGY
jgi:phenylacetaldehyde dehydrogenase